MDLLDYLTSEFVHFFFVFSFFLLSIFRLSFCFSLSFGLPLHLFFHRLLSNSSYSIRVPHVGQSVVGWLPAGPPPQSIATRHTHTHSERERKREKRNEHRLIPNTLRPFARRNSQPVCFFSCRVLWLELLPKFRYLKAVKFLGFDGREKVADRFWSVQVFRRLCPSFSGDRNLLTDKPK